MRPVLTVKVSFLIEVCSLKADFGLLPVGKVGVSSFLEVAASLSG